MSTKKGGKQGKGREDSGSQKEPQESKGRGNKKFEDTTKTAKAKGGFEEDPKGVEEKKTEEPKEEAGSKKQSKGGSKKESDSKESTEEHAATEDKKDLKQDEKEQAPSDESKTTKGDTAAENQDKGKEKEPEKVSKGELPHEDAPKDTHKSQTEASQPTAKKNEDLTQAEAKTEPTGAQKHGKAVEEKQAPVNEEKSENKEPLKEEHPRAEETHLEEPKKTEQQDQPQHGAEETKQADVFTKQTDNANAELHEPILQQPVIAGDENIKSYMREFNHYDVKKDGTIPMSDLGQILKSLNKDVVNLDSILAKVLPHKVEVLSISEFLSIMEEIDHSYATRVQGNENTSVQGNKILITPDEKVVEFLKVLTEYVVKAEVEGNYSEAKKARAKMEEIKIKEIIRQQNQIRLIQEEELLQVEHAQKYQFAEFTRAWDNYMTEYQAAANLSLQKLKEKHTIEIREFQENLRKDLAKGYKASKQLNELRQKEQALVKMQKYTEAERTQTEADALESWERANKDRELEDTIEKKTLGLKKQHQVALNALIKRIQKDHAQQLTNRQNDSQKLQLKSRNTRTDLLTKHANESKKALESIKTSLNVITSTRAYSSISKDQSQKNLKTEESRLAHDLSGKIDLEQHHPE